MIHYYKDRALKIGTKVKVYFNLHTHLFSIIAMEGEYKGKVVAHGNGILIGDKIKFHINKSGQEKVRKIRQRNVHAYVIGVYKGLTKNKLSKRGYYNPYTTDTFVDSDTNEILNKVEEVMFADKHITYN